MEQVIYPVIAPPRSSSTMVGVSLSLNSKIDGYCHEPFFILKYEPEAADKSYEEIRKNGKHVVVKEMSQWLDINDEYKRFLDNDKAPLFLIRDPLLCSESRLRKLIKTFVLREKKELVTQLNEMGYKDINEYAQGKGFNSADIMVDTSITQMDYAKFEDLLSNDGLYKLENNGWAQLEKQINYLDEIGRNFLLIDATDYRSEPEKAVAKVCDSWGLEVEDQMISWGKGNLDIETGQDENYQQIWYERLKNSGGIQPPIETCVSLKALPTFIADYMLDVCIPIYERLKERANG